MCVIIIKNNRKRIDRSILSASARLNPHGLGVVWLDNYSVNYYTSREFGVLDTERPFIAHFRYATVGAINKENVHPFVCGENKHELLMMNGTIHGLGDHYSTDSKMLANRLGTIDRSKWNKELSKYKNVKFVTINTRTKSYQMYNRDLWTYRDGVWYSKDNVLETNLIAVYGTLKMNYSNYMRYLTSSKFIGSGKTVKRYPLVIQGLPYMVDKEGVGHHVSVDVFAVSDETLLNIDQLEGHPKWYRRKKVDINVNGQIISCWLYFNKIEVNEDTVLHKSYTQRVYSTRENYQLF